MPKRDLIKSLRDFTKKEILTGKKRLVIAIERKGIAMLWAFSDGKGKNTTIYALRAIRQNPNLLENFEEIVIFDDVSWTGTALRDAKDEIMDMLNRFDIEPRVYTACYFYNHRLDEHNRRPDLFKDGVARKTTRELSRDTHLLIHHLMKIGRPINIDQIICDFRLSFSSHFKDVLDALSGRGDFYSTYIDNHADIEFWSLENPTFFKIPNFGSHPRLFQEGVTKLRIYRHGRRIRIVPMVFPVIMIQDISKENCVFRKKWKTTNFCGKLDYPPHQKECDAKTCYQCISFNLALELLQSFIYELHKEREYGWKFMGINKDELASVFVTKGKDFWKDIEYAIQQYHIGNNQYIPCNLERVDHVQIDSPTPVKIISSGRITSQNVEAQVVALVTGVCQEWKKVGYRGYISFSEILKAFHDKLTHREISQSIDILFDRNFLKPEIEYVKINGESALARTYSYSGEIVGALVRTYSDMIIEL